MSPRWRTRREAARLSSAVFLIGLLLMLGSAACVHHLPVEEFDPAPLLPRSLGTGLILERPAEPDVGAFVAGAGERSAVYLPFNLRRVLTFRYREDTTGHVALEGELCLLDTPLEAWGLTSRLDAAGRGRDVNAGVWQSLCRGVWAAVLAVRRPASVPRETVAGLAVQLVSGLPGDPSPPREVKFLRDLPGRVGDLNFEPVSVAGSRLLAPALTAPFSVNARGGRATVFISTRTTAGEVGSIFDRYLGSKATGRKGVAFVLGIGETAATVWDAELGWVYLARDGNRLVGVAGHLESGDDVWPLVGSIIAGLR